MAPVLAEDVELLRRVEDLSFPASAFDHRAHLRVCWTCLHGPDALARVGRLIERYAASVGATGKFHRTITAGWVALVALAKARHPTASFAALLAAEPGLLDRDALGRWWSPERLASPEARAGHVAPDRERLPIRLVPPDPKYADALYRWRCQPSQQRNNPIVHLPVADLRARLTGAPKSLEPLQERDYRFFVAVGGELVGNVSLKRIDRFNGLGEIGYGVDEAWHGLGIGGHAVRAFVADVFARTPLRKLVATVAVHNAPSIAILERTGFTREGTLRHHLVVDGRPTDHHLYGLLRGRLG